MGREGREGGAMGGIITVQYIDARNVVGGERQAVI